MRPQIHQHDLSRGVTQKVVNTYVDNFLRPLDGARAFRSAILTLLAAFCGLAIYLSPHAARASAGEACEGSHLSAPAEFQPKENLEFIAHKLASWRLEIYQQDNSTGNKARSDEEFKAKYKQFEILVGSKEKAAEVFAEQMRLVKQGSRAHQESKDQRREKEQREREKGAVDPILLARKMQFHDIRPGEFNMGDHNKVQTEITKPFAMMDTPVTQMMWARLKIMMGETDPEKINPSKFRSGNASLTVSLDGIEIQMRPDHPIEQITWNDVSNWIQGLNQLSKSDHVEIQALLREIIPDHQKDDVYDLPTEAQWEYVARNLGRMTGLHFDRNDESELSQYAHYGQGLSKGSTLAVASLSPRMIDGREFYDLEGNVWEWMKDAWDGFRLPPGRKDPLGIKGSFRSIRGGSWNNKENALRLGYRAYSHPANTGTGKGVGFRFPEDHDQDIGFRLVREAR